MKLGIAIQTTSSGMGQAWTHNQDPWTASMYDIRTPLRAAFSTAGEHPFDTAGTFVTSVTFRGEKGYLVTITKAAGSGRPGDNTAAWIHFPARVAITAREQADLLKAVATLMQGDDIDTAAVEKLFDKDYPEVNVDAPLVATIVSPVNRRTPDGQPEQGKQYGPAVRMYADLADVLGASLPQPEYADYTTVFMLQQSNHPDLNPDTPVITSELQPAVTIAPPTGKNYGFTCELATKVDGKSQIAPFDHSVQMLAGTLLSVIWKRPGFKSMNLSAPVTPDMFVPVPKFDDIIRMVKSSWFKPVDAEGRRVRGALVTINGSAFGPDGTLKIHEADLANGYTVKVTAPGYNATEAHMRGVPSKVTPIVLGHNKFTYDLQIALYGEAAGQQAQAHIVTDEPLTQSPVLGYMLQEGINFTQKSPNALVYDASKTKQHSIIAGAIGFAAGLLVMGIIWLICALCAPAPQPDAAPAAADTEAVNPAADEPSAEEIDALTDSPDTYEP